jgi:hypothetical protein
MLAGLDTKTEEESRKAWLNKYRDLSTEDLSKEAWLNRYTLRSKL